MRRTRIIEAACLAVLAGCRCGSGGLQPTVQVNAAPSDRIAFLDLQRATVETAAGTQAKARLMRKYRGDQNELNERQRVLQQRKDALDRESAVLKPSARDARMQELQAKFVELQSLYTRMQKGLEDDEHQATAGIAKNFQEVITDLARQRGLSAIVDKANAVYVDASLDLTDEAIRAYDAKFPAPPALRSEDHGGDAGAE
jgi:Skp family chaperone for outer membrane proteins